MSEVKVNKISPRTACGTVTLGDSGDTITIPAGVTITNSGTAAGFGATGAASWDTTVKTSGFTAVSGVGYFVNTTAGAISVNLPAGTAGEVVAFKDYANTFDTNNLTLVQNGSDKIGGSTNNAILSTEGIAVTLVYVDSTQGWLVTDDGLQSQAVTNPYLIATGGTITEDGDYKIHTFTGPGTFTVTNIAPGPSGNPNNVDYLVVAGGGGGGADNYSTGRGGGGGGAGGYRLSACTFSEPAGRANPCGALPVSVQGYSIVVGGGGTGGAVTACAPAANGSRGSVSTFSTITSAGGGAGNGHGSSSQGDMTVTPGGSGGGFQGEGTPTPTHPSGGKGNTPPTSPVQGFNAGDAAGSPNYHQGGGGGAGGRGGNAPTPNGGIGGVGSPNAITGAAVSYAGGGGSSPSAAGSPCGTGGAAGSPGGCAGTINRGGGGGGARGSAGNAGGSGIVIIRYKFQ
ncbi:hypothetical protein N9W19_00130 [bacterium]|nr:hypothetical protein [bacterium]